MIMLPSMHADHAHSSAHWDLHHVSGSQHALRNA